MVTEDDEDPPEDLVALDAPAPPPHTTHNLLVPLAAPSARLDRFLADHLPALSRARIQGLMDAGHVTVDGHVAKPSQKVRPGQQVTLVEPAAVAVALVPQDLPLSILFEDEHLLALNKAAGMVVHPAAGNPDGTVVNALLWHVRDLRPISGEIRPGIVHRLDKDTSGVMVVAKGDAALKALQDQFRARSTLKRYLALARGVLPERAGTWDTAFGRHPTQRMRFTSRAGARRAVTDFRVVASGGGCSLLELTLHTGRTHQIRVHCAEHGVPLLGDVLYGGRQAQRLPLETPVTADRQMLHAAFLKLTHPEKPRQTLRFHAPLPEDLVAVARALGLDRALLEVWKVAVVRD